MTYHIFAMSLYAIHQGLWDSKCDECRMAETVPSEYHEYLPLFRKVNADQLLPYWPYDHRNDLREGFEPPFGPLYSLSRPELEALQDWLRENLSKGFIRTSSSSAGSPILFIKKSNRSVGRCVDYRTPNEGTIKNRYPLPLVKETLMRLAQAHIFTKLDVRGAYNLIRMKEGDKWKTAFKTRYGLFYSLVMPFGLTNPPATFQSFITVASSPYLDNFAIAYLDDNLMYSNDLQEHQNHIKKVLAALTEQGLYLKLDKCEFHTQEVKYLGLIVGAEGIKMHQAKVESIRKWPTAGRLHHVRAFLGSTNFY